MNKKSIIIILVILLVVVLSWIVEPEKNVEEIETNNILQNDENSDEFVNEEENTIPQDNLDAKFSFNITEAEASLLEFGNWMSGDIDLSTHFIDLDYTKIKRNDEDKEIVYTQKYEYTFQGTSWDNIIPVININSVDAVKINQIIEESMINYYSIEYKICVDNDVLSILIAGDSEESMVYSLYEINIYTGEVLNR